MVALRSRSTTQLHEDEDAGPVGMTFGGGCFFGHGAYITSGAATFARRSDVINP
jgi:hypothetical protein